MLQLINPTHLLIKVRGRNNIDPWMVYLLLVFKQPLDVTVQCVGIALEVLDIDLFVLQLLTELHLVATQVLNLIITSIGLLYKWRVESQCLYKTQNITYGKGKGFFYLYYIEFPSLTWIVTLIFFLSSPICLSNVPFVSTFLFIFCWASPLVTMVSLL